MVSELEIQQNHVYSCDLHLINFKYERSRRQQKYTYILLVFIVSDIPLDLDSESSALRMRMQLFYIIYEVAVEQANCFMRLGIRLNAVFRSYFDSLASLSGIIKNYIRISISQRQQNINGTG